MKTIKISLGLLLIASGSVQSMGYKDFRDQLMKDKAGNALYKCLTCNEIVTSKAKTAHANHHKKPFACRYCDKSLASGSEVVIHTENNHPDKEAGYMRKGIWITNGPLPNSSSTASNNNASTDSDRSTPSPARSLSPKFVEVCEKMEIGAAEFEKSPQITTVLCRSCGSSFNSMQTFKEHKPTCSHVYVPKIKKRIAKQHITPLFRNEINNRLLTQQKLVRGYQKEVNPFSKLLIYNTAVANQDFLSKVINASKCFPVNNMSSNSSNNAS